MVVGHESLVKGKLLTGEGISGASKKVLIHPGNGWEDNVMRVFELEKDGYTPRHRHPWPHINYIIRGSGTLFLDGKNHELTVGSYAFVPDEKEHQFMANQGEDLAFICIVPLKGDPNWNKDIVEY
ncbi:MAG: cupin domain-containing protein [Deltaproteobacteria bacterium]|nr:cupin domain-containing protein [Deltaproteobacteria bacterium]